MLFNDARALGCKQVSCLAGIAPKGIEISPVETNQFAQRIHALGCQYLDAQTDSLTDTHPIETGTIMKDAKIFVTGFVTSLR
jgi:hypothetical protein